MFPLLKDGTLKKANCPELAKLYLLVTSGSNVNSDCADISSYCGNTSSDKDKVSDIGKYLCVNIGAPIPECVHSNSCTIRSNSESNPVEAVEFRAPSGNLQQVTDNTFTTGPPNIKHYSMASETTPGKAGSAELLMEKTGSSPTPGAGDMEMLEGKDTPAEICSSRL